jgi:hypothetical protein
MAAKAMVTLSPERVAWWEQFQSLAELRVQEGNLLCGERLWQIVKSPDKTGTLLIQSTRHPDDSVECSLDLQTAVLRCRPGTDMESPGLMYRLQRDDGECSVEQALHWILDQLVWREDCDCGAAELES